MNKWLALLTATVLCGCGGPPPAQPDSTSTASGQIQLFPNWPPLLNDFRFRWTSEPGIDLTIGPATIACAYLESFNVATYTLDMNNAYPGFIRATPESQLVEGNFEWQLVSTRPLGEGYTLTAKDAVSHPGYVALHLLELNPIGSGWEAIVCEGSYALFIPSTVQPGKFVSVAAFSENAQPRPGRSGAPDSGVEAIRVQLTQHDPRVGPSPPARITAPQRGPAPAPDQDVFGNWFITGASSRGWGPNDDPRSLDWPPAELERRCGDAMPQNEAERLAILTGFKDQPPPPGAAEPGWPLPAG